MSSPKRSSPRAVLIVAAIVVALLFVHRQWFPATVTLDGDEPTDIEAPTAGDTYTHLAKGLAEPELKLTIADPCVAAERGGGLALISTEELSARIAEYEDVIRRVKTHLVVSLDAEHLHAAAILETDPTNRIELMTKALRSGRNDAFLAWDAVRICAEALEQTSCPMREWEDRLLALDGQNSEVWVRIAANRLLADDNEAALSAMQRAASAAETRVYWSESIEMYERAFAAAGDYAFPERAAIAFGIAASNQPSYFVYSNMCKEQSAKSQEWAHACLAYGALVERQGKTEMAQSIARSIQERALETLGENEQLAAVVARQELARRNRREFANSGNELSEAILISNSTVFSGYLAAIRKDGEVAAKAYLFEETGRWLNRHKDLECIP